MLKKYLMLPMFVILIVVLSGCGASKEAESNQETVTLQLGHALSPGTPASDNIEALAQKVEKKTDGRVNFDIYGNGQLGSETEMLEQMQIGSMQAGAIMVGSMQYLDLRMAIEDLPYMWTDVDHARKAYKGEFGDYLADIMAGEGMTKIGYMEWGNRHITNNKRPIVEPEDLEGMKIRVAETALRVDAFNQVDALPTVMAFSEVYGALQQGALDAQENPLANIVAPRLYEVQDYLSLTGHFYNTVMLAVDTDTWEQISEKDQQTILNEAEKASDRVIEENDEAEKEYLAELEEYGVKINDNVDTEAFRKEMLPIYEEWEKEVFGEELMEIYNEASGWEE